MLWRRDESSAGELPLHAWQGNFRVKAEGFRLQSRNNSIVLGTLARPWRLPSPLGPRALSWPPGRAPIHCGRKFGRAASARSSARGSFREASCDNPAPPRSSRSRAGAAWMAGQVRISVPGAARTAEAPSESEAADQPLSLEEPDIFLRETELALSLSAMANSIPGQARVGAAE
jgi:hypothetical protein